MNRFSASLAACVRRSAARATPLLLCCAAAPAAAQPAGSWRISSGAWAPWTTQQGALANALLRGQVLQFEPDVIVGPAPLGCARADYEYVVSPAEGVFQGALPEPRAAAARAAGLTRLPVMTLAVRCDSGLFDYHFVEPGRMLLALDNVIWTIEAQPGPGSPSETVRVFLATHMTGDMAFTPASVREKQGWLTTELAAAITAHFARPMPVDEPPPINGDPFTNSQEYPDRFRIMRTDAADERATVRVGFRDGGERQRDVDVLLRRVAGRWLIDDLRYDDGVMFRALLR